MIIIIGKKTKTKKGEKMKIGDYVTITMRGRVFEAKEYKYTNLAGEEHVKVLYTLSSDNGEGAYFTEDKITKNEN